MTTDSMDKIRLKGGLKQYKRGPGAVGRARLEQRIARLVIDLHRFSQHVRVPNDFVWARTWLDRLRS